MVQGLLKLKFCEHSCPDRDLPYGVPILILPHQISSWYNGGFSIYCGASFYHRCSTVGSVAILKRARVIREYILPFWRSNEQHLCHHEGIFSMHIPCVHSQMQL